MTARLLDTGRCEGVGLSRPYVCSFVPLNLDDVIGFAVIVPARGNVSLKLLTATDVGVEEGVGENAFGVILGERAPLQ